MGTRLGPEYKPRRVEQTALFQIMQRHLPAFIDHVQAAGRTLPTFVRDELEGLTTCGVLAHGFALCLCDRCGEQRLVPLSCRGRGICPSCTGRRMADTAARLTDQVIPFVPVRHWTLSLPFPLRYLVAFDADLMSAILGICVREIYAWLRHCTRRLHELDRNVPLHCGSVTAIHRADSAAKLNPHMHAAALDGCYMQSGPDGPLTFLPTPAPTRPEVAGIAWSICRRTVALLKRRGLALDATPEELDPHHGNEPLLGECATASLQGIVLIGPRAGRSVWRLGSAPQQTPDAASPPKPAHGFDLHTGRRV